MDRELKIAVGDSNHAVRWSNKTITFDDLCKRLETTIRTSESAEEYAKAPKPVRDSIKDKGGFVGGALRGGRRKRANVECRSMVMLDGDKVPETFIAVSSTPRTAIRRKPRASGSGSRCPGT